jgi:hypothetical protein
MFETACDQARRLLRDVARLGLEEAEREQAVRRAWVERRSAARAIAAVTRALGEAHLAPADHERVVAALPAAFREIGRRL